MAFIIGVNRLPNEIADDRGGGMSHFFEQFFTDETLGRLVVRGEEAVRLESDHLALPLVHASGFHLIGTNDFHLSDLPTVQEDYSGLGLTPCDFNGNPEMAVDVVVSDDVVPKLVLVGKPIDLLH